MGTLDLSKLTRPERSGQDGMVSPQASRFRSRMPESAKRHTFLRRKVLGPAREAEVNPNRSEVRDISNTTAEIKTLVLEMGAKVVGVAKYDPRFVFRDATVCGHTRVVVIGMSMQFDQMIDIGPPSQAEVHRVYYNLDDMAVRLARYIGSYGYRARAQTNAGDFPLPAYAYLAGLGELGKHGSLISPELGSAFRLVAVSTELPLEIDGPKDFGIDEICKHCNLCTRFCPGEAISSEKQEVNGVSRWHVDTPACRPWFYELYGCKLCLTVCPFNARGLGKDTFKVVADDIREAKDAKGMIALISERSGETFEVPDSDAGSDMSDKDV